MTMRECGLHINRQNKEVSAHGSPEFPCAAYYDLYTDAPEDVIPWHWHEELEIIYIASGRMIVRIPSDEYLLEAGDLVAINGNMLHYCIADPACQLQSMVFLPSLIAGSDSLVYEAKYVRPLLSCPAFTGYYIKGSEHPELAEAFLAAHRAVAEDAFGYEFTAREQLTHILLYLYQQLAPQFETSASSLSLDNLRARRMLDYMQRHFAESLTLADIAREADISERECLRCFHKTIGQSPIQYLLKYRVMQGADMLLNTPGRSISEIASACGFDSQSNYTKMFKRFYGCTPREYRRNKNKAS